MPLSSPTSYIPNASTSSRQKSYSKRPYYLLCMSSQSNVCHYTSIKSAGAPTPLSNTKVFPLCIDAPTFSL